MKKFIFVTLFTGSLLFFFTSCNKKLNEKEITLVMAEVNPAETIAGKMDQYFKEKVEELSAGKIKINLQCSGILGDVDSVMDLMLKPHSTVQIHRVSAVNLAAYGCKNTSMLSIPYTFTSREHFWKFTKSEFASELLDEPEVIGLKGLFFGEEGFRHFFSTKQITNPDDFKKLKTRVTNDKSMQGILSSFQAESIPVNYADLYSALQTGIVEAAEQPIANYLANHFNKVAPYMILDGHTLGVMETVITLECWDSLSEQQKDILYEAGKLTSEYCRELSESEEEKVKAALINDGAIITTVTDIELWQKSCLDVIKDGAEVNPVLYNKIISYAK